MKPYDVFKSEGGYRVALSVYLGGPVMGNSPWFPTLEEAEEVAEQAKLDAGLWVRNQLEELGEE